MAIPENYKAEFIDEFFRKMADLKAKSVIIDETCSIGLREDLLGVARRMRADGFSEEEILATLTDWVPSAKNDATADEADVWRWAEYPSIGDAREMRKILLGEFTIQDRLPRGNK